MVSSRIQELASAKCLPCDLAVPFSAEEVLERLKDLPGWAFQSAAIEKEFRFRTYSSGLEFACILGKIAETEDHHPEMLVGWRRVRVSLSTHVIKGVSANDFVMAAKSEIEYSKIFGR